MSVDNFLNKNLEHEDEQEGEDDREGEDEQEEDVQEGEEGEENDDVYEFGVDINHQNEGNIKNKAWENKMLGARSLEDRIEIIFHEYGVPIGLDQRVKVVPDKDLIWTYVNQKYIIPYVEKKLYSLFLMMLEGHTNVSSRKSILAKYKTAYERLKNRLKDIPESHFKELIRYWSLGNIKVRFISFNLC
ncbi:hypothetical protein Lal_00032857 [Lupinus albus]|nr:hypothetical protein Lal_00032857 [Lupinus albus]